jgi:hypothetical protein
LINAHTHSHGGLAKGMGDRWTAAPRRDLEKAQMQPGEAVINA